MGLKCEKKMRNATPKEGKLIFNTIGHVSTLVSYIMLLCNMMHSSENTALKALKLATLSRFQLTWDQALFFFFGFFVSLAREGKK